MRVRFKEVGNGQRDWSSHFGQICVIAPVLGERAEIKFTDMDIFTSKVKNIFENDEAIEIWTHTSTYYFEKV